VDGVEAELHVTTRLSVRSPGHGPGYRR
jgi:hypothetical protein